MNSKQHRITRYFILFLLVVAPQTVLAQDPVIEGFSPTSAPQGTIDLDVTITGQGFDKSAKVQFLIKDTNDPGGIAVGRTKVTGSTKIVTTIDIADLATVAEYEVVVSMSRGRGGKGTTLFTVQSKDNGGGTGSTLSAVFCLNMTAENPGLASDGQLASNEIDEYCHDRKERVQVETGAHPGFRFDSNTKSRPPLRWVEVNFPGGWVTALDDDGAPLTTFVSTDYQLDLRFNRGKLLDLGSMLPDSDPGAPDYFVPVNIHFKSLDGMDHFAIAFSTDTDPLGTGALADNTCVRDNTLDAQVKLLDAGGWSIESNPGNPTACLWDLNLGEASFDNQLTGTPVEVPFFFIIEIK